MMVLKQYDLATLKPSNTVDIVRCNILVKTKQKYISTPPIASRRTVDTQCNKLTETASTEISNSSKRKRTADFSREHSQTKANNLSNSIRKAVSNKESLEFLNILAEDEGNLSDSSSDENNIAKRSTKKDPHQPLVSKASASQSQVSKAPPSPQLTKVPVPKAQVSEAPPQPQLAKSPVSQAQVNKAPVVSQTQVSKAPVSQAHMPKAPGSEPQVNKFPVSQAKASSVTDPSVQCSSVTDPSV